MASMGLGSSILTDVLTVTTVLLGEAGQNECHGGGERVREEGGEGGGGEEGGEGDQ